jgi:hypothetical protein
LRACLPQFVKDCLQYAPRALETHGRRETKKMLKERDKLEGAQSRIAASAAKLGGQE